MEGNRVITAVRVRPMSAEEESCGSRSIVSIDFDKSEVVVLNPVFYTSSNQSEKLRKLEERAFACDCPFWSMDDTHPDYSGQSDIFEKIGTAQAFVLISSNLSYIGKPIVEHAYQGMNCSLFAYGQTGSGKTHTMMGNIDTEEAGVIPRLCRSIIAQAKITQASSVQDMSSDDQTRVLDVKLSVSYYEIYNERVYDLVSSSPECPCRVREHPSEGAFVENLTIRDVQSYEEVHRLLEEGQAKRQTAETLMNAASSRSHAVFTLYISQKIIIPPPVDATSGAHETTRNRSTQSNLLFRKSKVCLVDLAGSERLDSTGASGDRLKEATNINRSLFVLGEVIKALSESSSGEKFVPYRNSILTWILKDSLGGNSKTTMLATISPIDTSFAESLNTLRYVERAKLIVSKAVVNDDNSNDPYVKHLQQQVALYKGRLGEALAKMRDMEVEFQKQLRSFREGQGNGKHEDDPARTPTASLCARPTSMQSTTSDIPGDTLRSSCHLSDTSSRGVMAESMVHDLESDARDGHVTTDLHVDLLSDDEDVASTCFPGDLLAVDLSRMDSGDSATDDEALYDGLHLNTELKQLRDALRMSMHEYNALNQQLMQAEDLHRIEVEFLEERLQSAEQELQSLRAPAASRKDDRRASLVQMEGQVSSLSNIVEQLQVRLTAKESEMRTAADSHRDQVKGLSEQCNTALRDADDIRQELHLLKEQHEGDKRDAQELVESLRQALTDAEEEASGQREALEAQMLELADIVAQQQKEYAASAAHNEQCLTDMKNKLEAITENEREKRERLEMDHECTLAKLRAAMSELALQYETSLSEKCLQLAEEQNKHNYAMQELTLLRQENEKERSAHETSLVVLQRAEGDLAVERIRCTELSELDISRAQLLADMEARLSHVTEQCRKLEGAVVSLLEELVRDKAGRKTAGKSPSFRSGGELHSIDSTEAQVTAHFVGGPFNNCLRPSEADDPTEIVRSVHSQVEAVRDWVQQMRTSGSLSDEGHCPHRKVPHSPVQCTDGNRLSELVGKEEGGVENMSSDVETQSGGEQFPEQEDANGMAPQSMEAPRLLQERDNDSATADKQKISSLEMDLLAERTRGITDANRLLQLERSCKSLEEENTRLQMRLDSMSALSDNPRKSRRGWFICS